MHIGNIVIPIKKVIYIINRPLKISSLNLISLCFKYFNMIYIIHIKKFITNNICIGKIISIILSHSHIFNQ